MKTSHSYILVVDHMDVDYTSKGKQKFKVVGWRLWKSPKEVVSIPTDNIYAAGQSILVSPQEHTLKVI